MAAAPPGADSLLGVQRLAQELQSGPKEHANNVVKLLQVLSSARQEAMQRAALQALKMFFIESSHESPIMHVSNFPLDPNGASNAPAPASDAQAVYQAWVQRQHNTYLDALFNLVTAEQHSASIQVAAASAVMEAVRSAGGAGVLVPDLLLRLVQAMATAPGVKPEVFTLFFTRYFQYADVRYYSLISIKHIASIQSSRRSSSAPAAAGGGGQQAAPSSSGAQQKLQGRQGAGTKDSLPVPASSSAADGKGTNNSSEPSTSENGTTLSGGDVFRNLFDMLAAMPDPPSSTSDSEAPGKGKVQEGDDDEDQPALRSWCGLAETVGVAAAPDKNESSKARRKRKAAEALAQEKAAKRGPGAAAAAAASQQRVAWANPKNQRRVYSDAWVSVLQLQVPDDLYRKVLIKLHETVIPTMLNPTLLADFLTYALDQGGLTGMLALNGIFLLVTRHGLEYPPFYRRLYTLLTQEAFAAKHRAQFFGLADIFLSSPLVPAYTVASFVKRFARLGMRASPAGAMLAIAFIHNLIRRHPSLMVMLHKPPKSSRLRSSTPAAGDGDDTDGSVAVQGAATPAAGGAGCEDVYNESEEDPAYSRAVESSLWEVEALKNHYSPQVAALAGVLDKDLGDRVKTSEVDITPLLTASYASLFTQEVDRRIKQVPIAFYAQQPSGLFTPDLLQELPGWEVPNAVVQAVQ